MNSFHFFLTYAKYRYIGYRLFLRLKMGKRKRNEYLQKNRADPIVDFLPERPYSVNGIKAIPRRYTNDFYMLFTPREEALRPHLIMYENETFVDVGANVGTYSLNIANAYRGKGVNVIAIEAHPENYKALCKNIKLNNFKCVKTVNKAVSDNKGIVAMYEYLGYGYSARFEACTISNVINRKTSDGNSSLQVQSDTLDNILEGVKVDLMKIDIEGAEVLALKGATKTLKQLRKIIVEIHQYNFEKVRQILESYNFKLELIGECVTVDNVTQMVGYVIGSK
jgi:FkbM family methyltransferase